MSTPDSTGYSLIPDVSSPALPSDELSLLDQLADPSVVEPQAPEPEPIGRSYAYDYVNQRLLPGLAGGPLMTYGLDSLEQWISKTLITDRAAAPIHKPTDYGVDGANEFLDGSVFDASAASELHERVVDALLMHPRISEIRDWRVDYDDGSLTGNPPDDAIFVSFTVVVEGNDGDPLSITRYPLTAPGPQNEGG